VTAAYCRGAGLHVSLQYFNRIHCPISPINESCSHHGSTRLHMLTGELTTA